MTVKRLCNILLCVVFSTVALAQQAEIEFAVNNYHRYYADGQKVKDPVKEKSIQGYRQYFATHGYRSSELGKIKMSAEDCIEQLNENGQFSDMLALEKKIQDEGLLSKGFSGTDNILANFLTDAHNRIWRIAEAYKKGKFSESDLKYQAFLKAILYYGTMEIGRSNKLPRFHASCFAIPTAAVNTYFCMLKTMDDVEAGKIKEKQLIAVAEMLKTVSLQAWTQPLRNDETDKNVVQIERFRNHVWWVGGNALAYRSLLPVAFMYKSIPMIDLLAEVCRKCISTTSQNTYNSAFWIEGFTTDGAGWGHGKQCLIWGYPIDGTSNALSMLNMLKASPWAQKLSQENVAALMNFFEGSNWYYCKGYTLPWLDRMTGLYPSEAKPIRSAVMVNTLLSDWKDSFTPQQLVELKQFSKEAASNNINMKGYADGLYSGTRWFFNNDDLMKKNDNCQIMVNMASIRCDGLESAANFADEYNFFPTDGMTLFQKNGMEYRSILGAFDITASPGVTAREGMDKITPVTNWRGYCSKFNFAGAATNGGENAVAGYIFEKMNASEKDNVNDKGNNAGQNSTIYGVQAHKSYFMLGDYFVALGAGVTNMKPEMEGTIRTTIDQTVHEGDVQVISNGQVKLLADGIQSFIQKGKPVWVKQEGKFAYTILPEYAKNAWFVAETKKTDWGKMHRENKKLQNLPATANILRLWVDHGQKPVNDTYGYVVFFGKEMPKDKLPFSVLRNDTLIQAISSVDSKITEVVFYQANNLLKTKNISLSASAPCVVLIETNVNEKIISVNDPCMNPALKQIELRLNDKTILVDLPEGELAGKPAVIHVKS
jgi:chondroitin AC lyase